MSKVAIVTDSTAHIPQEMTAGLPIFTIPVHVIWGGVSYDDDVTIKPAEFYRRIQHDPEQPRTSQATPPEFLALYKHIAQQGYDAILSIHLSARLTATLDSARRAASDLSNMPVELFDSMTGSMAMGWQALDAARAALAGATLHECRAVAEKVRAQTNIFFVPGTLEYLHRGGRINWATAFIGSMLQVTPIIETVDGLMLPVEKVRTMRRAMNRVLDLVEQKVSSASKIRLAALEANVPDLAAGFLEQARQRLGANRVVEAFVTGISPVLGAHIGPGAVGITYCAEP